MKRYFSIIMCIFLLYSSYMNVIAKESEDIQAQKEYITQRKNENKDMMTNEIFVKAIGDNCTSILSQVLVGYDYEIVKKYKYGGVYLLRFDTIDHADKAIDLLNSRKDIKFAEPNYIIEPDLGWPSDPYMDSTQTSRVPEVIALYYLDVIVGDADDGNLREEEIITRAEFATILCRAMGCEEESQTDEVKNKTYFPDVSSDHWAVGYINYAYENGAIKGFPDGNFYPEQTVTNEQVIKMIIAAWGYGDEAETNGGYPNGYMKVAKEHGVLDAISFNYANASKRWVASVFVYGALSMEPKNLKIKQILKTDPIVIEQVREEFDGYLENPEDVLATVTKESSLYERTVFEQTVPTQYEPVKLQARTMENISTKDYFVSIRNIYAQDAQLSKHFKENETIDLSNFDEGQYEIKLTFNNGIVEDDYSAQFLISGDTMEFVSPLDRVTRNILI